METRSHLPAGQLPGFPFSLVLVGFGLLLCGIYLVFAYYNSFTQIHSWNHHPAETLLKPQTTYLIIELC